jgi:hypothetical protein
MIEQPLDRRWLLRARRSNSAEPCGNRYIAGPTFG